MLIYLAHPAPSRPCPLPSPGVPLVHCGRGGHMFDIEEEP